MTVWSPNKSDYQLFYECNKDILNIVKIFKYNCIKTGKKSHVNVY